MTDLTEVSVYSESSDIYKNVFCNLAFELDGEREEKVEGFSSASTAMAPEPVKSPSAIKLKGRVDGEVVSTNPLDLLTGDGLPRGLPTTPTNHSQRDSTVAPQPARYPTPETRCGGVLTDSEGSFSSPNHPGSYPPDSLCVWVIRARAPSVVQIHVSSLTIEGPSPCLFDWLEVQEEMEQPSVVTRFCGNVAPPTVNANSSTVWVTFRSDGIIGGSGSHLNRRAAPGRSLCVTAGVASCQCRCVTASPTVMTTLMRPTAATSTKSVGAKRLASTATWRVQTTQSLTLNNSCAHGRSLSRRVM